MKYTIDSVKKTMENLIDKATNYDIEALKKLYHKNLYITMLYPDNIVKTLNKNEFLDLFAARKEKGDAQMNTWVDWHNFHINGENAVVVLSRINSVGGKEMKLKCSIDLVFEDNRWQIIREEIFFLELDK